MTLQPDLSMEHAAGAVPHQAVSPLRRLLRNPLGVACGAVVMIFLLVGVAGSMFAPYPPNVAALDAINAPPFSPGHLLGGDGSGRDILSRLIAGARLTAIACGIILTVSLVLGVLAGLIAGYYRGRFEKISDWVSDVIMSMPGLVLLIALYALTGPNVPAAMAVFGVLAAPSFYRLVRGIVHSVRTELYVDAAKVMGLSDGRIIGRHVLTAVRAPILIQGAFVLSAGIGIEAAVGFLGLGDPAQPSWGSMLQEAFGNIYVNGPSVAWPAGAITLTILAFVLFGNALRDAFQVTRPRMPRTKAHAVVAKAIQALPDTTKVATPSDPSAILSIRNLRIAYPTTQGASIVVNGVDLDIQRGEIRGLVGESGSGKSQTAFSVLGILPPEAVIADGSIVFDGDDLLAKPDLQRAVRGGRIAYIPQEPMSNLDPVYTVGAQLVYGLRATRAISRAEASKEVLALLARVGIKEPSTVFGQYPHQISGGMAQRVLICGAVASNPDFIIADEPTTALDVTVQAEVLSLLRELRDERNLGILLVTHNFGVVADICDSVSVMRSGQIIEQADVYTIFASPQHPYTKALLTATREVELGDDHDR